MGWFSRKKDKKKEKPNLEEVEKTVEPKKVDVPHFILKGVKMEYLNIESIKLIQDCYLEFNPKYAYSKEDIKEKLDKYKLEDIYFVWHRPGGHASKISGGNAKIILGIKALALNTYEGDIKNLEKTFKELRKKGDIGGDKWSPLLKKYQEKYDTFLPRDFHFLHVFTNTWDKEKWFRLDENERIGNDIV